jgi:putative flippase GtrA
MSMPAKFQSNGATAPIRFGLVGAANTITGLAVIAAGLAIGLGDIPANALGYAAGLAQGFILNRRWTFPRNDQAPRGQFLRYLLAFVPAYGANLLVVAGFVAGGLVANPLTHLAGIIAYTIVFYLLCAHFVFKADVPARHGRISPRLDIIDRAATSYDRFIRPYIGGALGNRGPEIIVALALVVAYALLWDMPITHDVIWQFWIARQLLHGATLYTDILEVNPPLWFWSAIPFQSFAEFAAVPAKRVAIAAVFILVACSVGLLAALFRGERADNRAAILLLACVALIVVPLGDFGQREHLAIIGTLPYIVLIAHRAEGRPTATILAILVGVLASYGFALKHYFVIIPLGLECWLALHRRAAWRILRPETATLCAFAAIYGAAAWVVAPGFFTNILPMVKLAYGGYEVPLIFQIYRPWVFVWLIGAIAIVLVRRLVPPVVILAAWATLGFIFSYFAQQKGWRYHALSASCCLTFAAGMAIVLWRGNRWKWLRHPGLPVACALPVVFALIVGPYSNAYEESARRALSSARPGDTVAAFSVNASLVWPMIDDASLIWPIRHFTYWMVPAIAHAEAEAGANGVSAEMAEFARTVRRDTAVDLWCRPPDFIVADDTRYSRSMRGADFNILEFFRRDPALDDLMGHYRKTNVVGRFTIYSRTGELAMPANMNCRPVADR